jgi:hypothetical protein
VCARVGRSESRWQRRVRFLSDQAFGGASKHAAM